VSAKRIDGGDDTLLVRTWHHSRFADIGRLVELKEKKKA
jgi:hypothetical protein